MEGSFQGTPPVPCSVTATGLPHAVNNPVGIQQSVNNLTVCSNGAGVQTGSFDRGQIEIWHHRYQASMLAGRGHVIVATDEGASKLGRIYLDGVLTGTGSASANTTDSSFQLGAIGGANFMKGAIGEVLIHDRVLSDPERANVEGYLTGKISLPADAALLDYNTWSATTISPPASAAPNADANANGIPNAIEFALKLGPENLKTLDVQTSPTTVDVRYFKPTDRSGAGIQLFESFDMEQWSPVSDTSEAITGGFEERRYSRPLEPQKKAFYKLSVTVP